MKTKSKNNYINFFRGKKITLMGLGILGRGVNVAKFLAECGAELTITDLKTRKELASSLEKLKKFLNIKYVLGGHDVADFRNKDMVIKAAGVPLDSIYIREAEKNKIPVEMDASLFAKLSVSNVNIIGITGTRGKSTTTQLIRETLKAAGKKVHLGGNVRGMATLPLLKTIKSGDIVVMELDSWQLQGFGEAKTSPHIAVFTNFMRDHMNYYKNDMKQYFNDKANIFKYQKNNDFLITGEKLNKILKKFYKDEIKSKIMVANAAKTPKNWRIKILGNHNLENIAAAVEACKRLGISDHVIKKSVEKFAGVPGRLEFAREIKMVKYYNDTAATTPEAVIAGLKAMKKYKGKIILIGGGADKNLDYKEYAKIIKKYVKALILFKGAASDKIVRAFSKTKFPVRIVDNMKKAIETAKDNTQKNDVVLLSPGAASFGVFKNEFDRGEQFNRYVNKLK